MDQQNGGLIGLVALGDPVFNLRVRDQWIGWDAEQRKRSLVNVMDAYVLGAVPPYSFLLGGKLIASLLAGQEVADDFENKYRDRVGIISGRAKAPRLAVITVTSALGRSSIYNRLKLPGMLEFCRLGYTKGYGHFQVSDEIFQGMRSLLDMDGHLYAHGYVFGDGPSWRIRVIRESLKRLGLDAKLLRHGIGREVFAMPLLRNWRAFLNGTEAPANDKRPSVSQISLAARERWLLPRAARLPEFREWRQEDTEKLLRGALASAEEVDDGPLR
jgi:hypothetical protein